MIGTTYKKFAAEYDMKVNRGVAYGSLGGYTATLCEGAGWKRIVFATSIPDAARALELQTRLNGVNLRKTYRVKELTIAPKNITVLFHDDIGTMKKLRAFLEFFLPLLEEAEAVRHGVCPECGCEVTGGVWKLVGGIAYFMHSACAEKVCRDIAESDEQEKQERTGNYFTGFIGAVLGSAIGAVVWSVILYFGYVTSLVGLLIGFLAEKGYNLFRGKQGKGKIAILVLAVILGVLVGNFGADVFTLVQMIAAGELEGFVYGDIPMLILVVLLEDSEYLMATLSNIGMGLLFAGLGVWGLLRRANAEVSATRVVDLK